MNSLILRTAVRLLIVLLLVFSVFIFFRGHDEPGGGFIGGLIAAGAFALYGVAFGPKAARTLLHMRPLFLIGFGLAAATASGLFALIPGEMFLTGQWVTIYLGAGELKIGSPLLFDIGVFSVVIGFVMAFVLSLEELDGEALPTGDSPPPEDSSTT
jgi:multisubunit Na+/H+ antiporter MnhB subunit